MSLILASDFITVFYMYCIIQCILTLLYIVLSFNEKFISITSNLSGKHKGEKKKK